MAVVRLRGEDPPPSTSVVIRGGERGLDDDMLARTATRNFEEFGFYGVSVFLALDGDVAELCESIDALSRYGQIRVSDVQRLHDAGFALVATGARPHFDIVLPDLSPATLERLRSCFGPSIRNPARSDGL